MFDLIGYWFNVSLISAALLAVPVAILFVFLSHAVKKAFPEEVASRIIGKVFKFKKSSRWCNEEDGYVLLFDKFKIYDKYYWVFIVPVAFHSCVYGMSFLLSLSPKATLGVIVPLEYVSLLSEKFAPLGTTIALTLSAYYGLIYALKKAYQFSVWIARVNDKLKD